MNKMPLRCILLIEDDPGDAVLIAEMIEQQGCDADIVTFNRLAEGIEFLKNNHCDVVLLDMNLPDSCGLSTMTRLLDTEPTAPIIVLTGISDEFFGIEAVKSGAQDYLVKGDTDGRLLKRSMFYAIERKKVEI